MGKPLPPIQAKLMACKKVALIGIPETRGLALTKARVRQLQAVLAEIEPQMEGEQPNANQPELPHSPRVEGA